MHWLKLVIGLPPFPQSCKGEELISKLGKTNINFPFSIELIISGVVVVLAKLLISKCPEILQMFLGHAAV